MASPFALLPLGVALLAVGVVAAAPVLPSIRAATTRTAIRLLGDAVAREGPRRTRQRRRMHAAHVAETHRAFVARALFTAGVVGAAAGVVAVYGAAWLVGLAAATDEAAAADVLATLTALAEPATTGPLPLFGFLAVASLPVGIGGTLAAYWVRWQYLDQRAAARANEIEASLPRTVAFLYALSRSGMAFPQVLDTLTRNRVVYGEAAREVGVAVRDMQTFGTDILTSVQQVANRTPSENMSEFAENLSSVLGSGQSVSAFLRNQYERYQEQAEAQQEQYLDLLSTFAEVYVTVLVAGPLFFVTVLVVIGLVLSDTLPVLRFLTYVGIPLASVGFVVYIDSITGTEGDGRPDESVPGSGAGAGASDDGRRGTGRATDGGAAVASDGGTATGTGRGRDARDRRNRKRLARYARFEPLWRWARDPIGAIARRPSATLALTLPAGLLWLGARRGATVLERVRRELARGVRLASPGPDGVLAAADGPLVEAALVAIAAYAVVHEVDKRRRRSLEDAVPDLLDRMASVNEAGLTVVESIDSVSGSELGPLDEELRRTRRDIAWGADAATALRRLDRRTDVPAITRAVTLITNAMAASGEVAPVLRIAADEAEQSRRLRRARRQQMVTYLLVIYVSFFVFLGIIGALSVSFIPAIESAAAGTTEATASGVSAGPFSALTEVNTAAYELLFFHLSAIQGVASGLIAGQLGEGSVRDGAKHAAVLLAITYAAFTVVL